MMEAPLFDDSTSGFLDIFSRDGMHIEHISLSFMPSIHNGLCCTTNRIFVACFQSPDIYIYTWKGVHIETISHQDLGLEEKDIIHAVQCNINGTLLHQAVGKDDKSVNSLHTYRIHPVYTPVEMRDDKHQTEDKKKEHAHPRETDDEIAAKRPRTSYCHWRRNATFMET